MRDKHLTPRLASAGLRRMRLRAAKSKPKGAPGVLPSPPHGRPPGQLVTRKPQNGQVPAWRMNSPAEVARQTTSGPAAHRKGTRPATLAASLREQMPRLDVTVKVGTRLHVATEVARGALDVGLLDGLTAPGNPLQEFAPLAAVGITQVGVVVVLPQDHPLAARRTLRLTDLVDARWIEAPDVAPPLSEIRRLAGVEGFRPAFRYGGTDTMALVRLAAAGHGLTLLPEPVLPMTGITAVAVTAPRIAHQVELVHGTLRNGSPAAELAALLMRRSPGMLVGCWGSSPVG